MIGQTAFSPAARNPLGFSSTDHDASAHSAVDDVSPGPPQHAEDEPTVSLLASMPMPEHAHRALLRSRLNMEVAHLRDEPSTTLDGGLSYQSAQFTDGARSTLLTFPGSVTVLARHDAGGTTSFYRITPEGAEQLFPGERTFRGLYGSATITISDDGTRLSASDVEGFMTFERGTYDITPGTGEVTGTSQGTLSFGLPPVAPTPIEADLWRGAALVDVHATPGTPLTPAEEFDYYANTPDGAALLAREQGFYDRFGDPERALFVARVRFNRGEGGIELFEDFMPDRAALTDDPAALAAYDEQFDRFFDHISSSGYAKNGGIPASQWDVGLRTIVAAAATEAMGHSPELVSMVLSDLDRGWSIAEDMGKGGTHSSWQPWFKSRKSHITLDLGITLFSFSRPTDAQDTVGHEMAHSLDAFGNDKKDGLPNFASAADRETFIRARAELTEEYRSSSPSALITRDMEYAFRNENEFWAQFSELFLSGAANAAAILAVSPELHGVLSRFYDITYP